MYAYHLKFLSLRRELTRREDWLGVHVGDHPRQHKPEQALSRISRMPDCASVRSAPAGGRPVDRPACAARRRRHTGATLNRVPWRNFRSLPTRGQATPEVAGLIVASPSRRRRPTRRLHGAYRIHRLRTRHARRADACIAGARGSKLICSSADDEAS
eukprot:8684689-Heterocapsa_arctica.AAC.2